jgi:hypothetical protein
VADAIPVTGIAPGASEPLLLYSTNTYLKFRIQQQYRGEHYVWCSPAFAAEMLNKYALGAGMPPSSDPASIYRELHLAVSRPDDHAPKIIEQRKNIIARAVIWCDEGHITETQRDDITAVVKSAPFSEWRPIVFVIPYRGVAGRVELVARARRASSEPEYIVSDLKPHEFGIVELKL